MVLNTIWAMKKIKNRFFGNMSESELHNELEEEIAAMEAEKQEKEQNEAKRSDDEKVEEAAEVEKGEESVETPETSETPEADETEKSEKVEEVNAEEELKAQLAKSKDDYLRLVAEFDNYRRRVSKEKLDLIATAGEGVIKAILPILDDFERALQALNESEDGEHAKEGTSLIYKKLVDMLKSQGVTEIDALGQELDTDLHEAVAQFATEDKKKKGKIIEVVQKGYKLGDKVIRFAKVVIGI